MDSQYYNTQLNGSLPRQKISSNLKTKSWKEQCVEAISNMGRDLLSNGRTSKEIKQINYDLVNSIFKEEDFNHVLNPYGVEQKIGEQPAQLHDYNIISNKINLLKGEEMSRPFNWTVMSVNGQAVSEKERQKKDMLLYLTKVELAKALGVDMEIEPPEGEELPQSLKEVDEYVKYNLTDIREEWASDILTYLKERENLQLKFNQGWEHSIISTEEIYYVGVSNEEPKLRVVNPINCDFDRNPDNPNIEDGDWFKEERWMTSGQILDEYGEFLSDAQVKKLDEGGLNRGLTGQTFPGFAYTLDDLDKRRDRSDTTHFLVTQVVWKSMKKIGFVSYPDENGEYQEGIVDESFKLDDEMKALGYELEWRWIPEIWKGTKIADEYYVDITPLPNQYRNMDNPAEVKLPYIGLVYNSTNSVPTGIVDLLKPYQYLYNVIWYRMETEIAKAKGKKMVMDLAQIPKSEGIDLDKWMYLFDNTGIAFVNSMEEGSERFAGQVSSFNQFTQIDMTLSQAMGQYISILAKIEQTADKIIGITPQREGNVAQHETVGGVERSITQSSYVTEPWFYMHNEVKKKVLTHLLEMAKFAYPDSKKIHYIMDDVQRINITVDMEKFSDSEYGVFVTNSGKEAATFQKLEGLAQQALSSGAASLSDIVSVYKATSVAELSNIIKTSEDQKNAREQQQQQQQQEMQQQQIQAQQQSEQAKQMFEAEQNQLDRDTDIRKAVIGSMGFDQDIQDNGVNDMVEYGKLSLAEMEARRKSENEKSKIENDKRKIESESESKEKDRTLKREEIASKERIEKLKARTALKNKVSGEK